MAKAETRGDHSITYMNGRWHDGKVLAAHPTDHGMWLASTVFDGARSIEGHAPDLDKHCARAVHSCRVLGMAPPVTASEIEQLARDGIAKFPEDATLYICPMFFSTDGFMVPDPNSTQFVLTVEQAPLPEPVGFKSQLSKFRRPARDMAPTEAKASCLYPNIARDVADAKANGFDNSIVLDPAGNVAEFSYANLFMAKDGAVFTPVPNGTFLNGITRQRIIQLLQDDGVHVVEKTLTLADIRAADELFATGNYAKVLPCIQFEARALQSGPLYTRARDLYFQFADQA